MELVRLERGGAVKLTANPQIIEELEALGYVKVGTEEVAEVQPEIAEAHEEDEEVEEEPKEKSPFETMKKDELIAFIHEKGATVPNGATKDILIEIAKSLEV